MKKNKTKLFVIITVLAIIVVASAVFTVPFFSSGASKAKTIYIYPDMTESAFSHTPAYRRIPRRERNVAVRIVASTIIRDAISCQIHIQQLAHRCRFCRIGITAALHGQKRHAPAAYGFSIVRFIRFHPANRPGNADS